MISVAKVQRRNAWRYYVRGVAFGDGRRSIGQSLKDALEMAGLPPGVWRGRGLSALGLTAGQVVTEWQMKLLFGEGRHPGADRMERDSWTTASTRRRRGGPPLGDRDQPGPVWVTNATLRLLLRLSGPKYRLLDAPVIHESWTSGATENFLDALRKTLAAARETAIAEDDTITLEYIKAMYSKFISTMGESIHNREMVRPDWMHIIHSWTSSP